MLIRDTQVNGIAYLNHRTWSPQCKKNSHNWTVANCGTDLRIGDLFITVKTNFSLAIKQSIKTIFTHFAYYTILCSSNLKHKPSTLFYNYTFNIPSQSYQRLRFAIFLSSFWIDRGEDASCARLNISQNQVSDFYPVPFFFFVRCGTFDYKIHAKLLH